MYLTKHVVSHPLDDSTVLLINTLSGGLDIVEQRLWHRLQLLPDSLSTLPVETIEHLHERGYLLQSPEQERELLLAMRERVREYEQGQVKTFGICPTISCNFRCTYCFEGVQTQRSEVLQDVPALFRGIASLERYLGLTQRPILGFYGGEPLLSKTWPVVEETLKTGAQRDYRFLVITNGYLLDQFLPLLSKFRERITYVQVSLDGPREIHDARRLLAGGRGTFDRVVQNIRLALQKDIPIHLRTNVDETNLPSLPALGRFLKETEFTQFPHFTAYLAAVEDSSCLGIRHVLREDHLARGYLELKRDRAYADDLEVFNDSTLFVLLAHLESVIRGDEALMLPNFRYCEATQGKNFLFGSDGHIYQCFKSLGDSEAAVGQFLPTFRLFGHRIHEWMARDILNLEPCNECVVATFCGGGCAYGVLKEHKELMMPNCPEMEEIIHNYLDYRKDTILSLNRIV